MVDALYTGYDVNLNARFAHGATGSVGVSSGANAPTTAVSPASPDRLEHRHLRPARSSLWATTSATTSTTSGPSFTNAYPSNLYCSVTPPYQPDWKGLIKVYPLPWWGFSGTSATWPNGWARNPGHPGGGPVRRRRSPSALSDARVDGQLHRAGHDVRRPASTKSTCGSSKSLSLNRTRVPLTASASL